MIDKETALRCLRRALPPLSLLLIVAAYERPAETQGGAVRQLAPGVFSRQGDKDTRQPANTSWIEFRNFVVVIDANTPWGIRAILPEIKKTTSKPVRYVFDTHYHWDHSQGNSVMADEGVTVICSQDCASELSTKGKEEWDSGAKRTDQYSLAPYRWSSHQSSSTTSWRLTMASGGSSCAASALRTPWEMRSLSFPRKASS